MTTDSTVNGLGPLGMRTPVLVGVGTASGDMEAVELMVQAVESAGSDASAPRLLASVDRITVPQGSWAYPDPARLVAERIGATGARTHRVELGIPQQSLINEAMAEIRAGHLEVAVVVGAEAKRWARGLTESGGPRLETAQSAVEPDVVRRPEGALLEPVEIAHRLWEPVQQYAMIDNALRAAEGLSLSSHRQEVAELWARFNRVAGHNPEAAFPHPMSATEINTPTAANRPLAFPYNKWHSTQWTVDQGAALILCSVEAAGRLGVPTDQWVFPLVGLESSHAVSLLRRQAPHAWPAMEVLAAAASTRLGRAVSEAGVIETYSCFPAAVRVQQRALGLDRAGTPTITGGMAFAGGPYNNFVLQATAAVVREVRARQADVGVVTTVSGLLTKPGIGVWSPVPDGADPLVADLATEVEAATGVVEVVETLEGYEGPATVATYTVTYDGLEPIGTVALCDIPDGRRAVLMSAEADLAQHALGTELIGAKVMARSGSFHLV
jgi:acetyl-CoA C-acetyltransferase